MKVPLPASHTDQDPNMLQIPCPYCGLRDQLEFRFGGEDAVERPGDPSAASDAEWANYLFYRENIKGPHFERWVHAYGCGRWFRLERDTLTHEILHSMKMNEPVPGANRP